MVGATLKRLQHRNAQALIHSALFTTAVPAGLLSRLPPTLLMWGQRDHLVPAEQLLHFKAFLPASAVIKLLPRMSHQSFALAHGPAARQLLRFVDRLVAANAAAAAAAAANAALPAGASPSASEVARHFASQATSARDAAAESADHVEELTAA